MKILVACEESQEVTKAFRSKGHEAYSCDIQECSGGHPEWHIVEDALLIANTFRFYTQDRIEHFVNEWDMIIAFPPCTHLCVSGAKHFVKKREDGRQKEAIEFFGMFLKSKCKYVAIENPIGIISGEYISNYFPELSKEFNLPLKPSCVIQPWQFGDKAQKSTCLWLKNLPVLKPTKIVEKGEFYITPTGKKMVAWMCDPVDENGKKLAYGSDEIKKLRSKTFPGIAKAMAEQWGNFLLNGKSTGQKQLF